MEMTIDDQPNLLKLIMKGSFDKLSADWLEVLSNRITKVPVDVLINLKDVTYINSKGLGALFSLHKHIEDNGYHIFFSQIPKEILEIFELAGLQHILRIYKSDDEAMEAIAINQQDKI